MKGLKNLWFVVLVILAMPLAINALAYINFDPVYGFLRLKQQAIATGFYLPAYYAHVLAAALILLIGIFQLHPTLGLRWRKFHRTLGKVYVGGVLFVSAPGALVMSFFINRGPLVLSSFVVQCTLWFVFTWLAYRHIRTGNIQAHRQWMLRSFALTLAAITLRLYVFVSSWSFDLGQPEAYATIAWLSWLPNLLICEWYLNVRRKQVVAT
ncbi:MAG: DUF2306 domain-containing protein [Cyclobacteriaceae bacterium]|nr:DUF2306 domain-containing protein [Cyclobacteriaceae bacterium]